MYVSKMPPICPKNKKQNIQKRTPVSSQKLTILDNRSNKNIQGVEGLGTENL
jgi:hypothetical protein